MNNKIKRYVDNLFQDAPRNRKMYELKEEMLANVNDKYNDLLDMGLDEGDAYTKAISSIGNIEELVQESRDYTQEEREYRKKSSMRVSLAVMMYILSPVIILLLSESTERLQILGVVVLLIVVAIATGILIYNEHDKPIRKSRIDDELYEEFIEWKDNTDGTRKMIYNVRSIIGSITLVTYFIVSFTFSNWEVSWVIFIIGAIVKNIATSHIEYKNNK